MITLYDIPSALPEMAWSLNTWRARYCLNYKHLPYKTEWIEYPDIEPHCKRLGIAPTSTRKDGTPYYSLPAIYDSTTDKYIADSLKIAEYLDEMYPDTPKVFPEGTEMLQHAFLYAYNPLFDPIVKFIIPATATRLNPVSEEYFTRTRTKRFGKPLKDVTPTGEEKEVEWKEFLEALDTLDGWFSKNKETKFITGNAPVWVDFVVGGELLWLKTIFRPDSDFWMELKEVNGGRWEKYLEDLQEWAVVI
ncbi:hypothetical protein BDQ12DRAFT_688876 [Crucibulum laeve]|uniref:GST N-terminal domain-containing protein n=1 Tax=Crucibulum laeve TaxID=68775 RepID=A0A5C3LPC5_9AGAR|nr:hypothetical protein BDQ12DRAFT_688876 [Crucibulum laeve]